MVIWSLFDSGKGSYNKVFKEKKGVKNYSIGLDIYNNKTSENVINLDLSKNLLFDKTIFERLGLLEQPDLIIASPPCESWSMASAMINGNASWKHKKQKSDTFTLRTFNEYEKSRYNLLNQNLKRLNGELTIINTIEIINFFKPKIYIIENPLNSKIWHYIEHILGFKLPFENRVRYNNYGYDYAKPTKFASNINLSLNNKIVKANKSFNDLSGYDNRSEIPNELVEEIYKKVFKNLTIKEK